MPDYTLTAPNGQTYRITAPDPAAAANALRELTGTAAPAGGAPVDLTRAANPQPPAAPVPFADPATGQITPEARATPLLDQIANPGTVGANAAMPAPGQIGSPYQIPQDDLGDLGFAPPRVAPGNPAERAFELGLQGAGAGIADVVGAPVDLGNAFLNLIYSGVNRLAGREVVPLQDRPFGGSQSIRDTATTIAEPLGLETLDREEMTPQERLGYDATRTGTGAVVGAGGAVRGAAALQRAPQALPDNLLGRVAGAVTAPYANSAGRAFAGDAAAGVGAGTANFAYEQFAPEALQESAYGPLGNMLANLVGGVTGATTLNVAEGVGRGAVRNADNILRGPYDRTVPPGADGRPFRRVDVDRAAAETQAQASSPFTAAAQIRSTDDALAEFASRGSRPTTGLLSDDVGLIMAENRARLQDPQGPPGEPRRSFVERDQQVRDAAAQQVDRIAPSAASGRQFTDEIENIYADRVGRADALVQESTRRVQDAELAGRGMAPELRIAEPRGARNEAALAIDDTVVNQTLRPMQDENAQMFAEARRLGATEAVNVEPIRGAVDEVTRSISQLVDPATNLPSDLAARITAAIDETGQITVADIVDLWPSLSRMEDAANRAGNVTLARNIRTLRDGFGDALDDAAQVGNLPGAQASIAARQNFADTLGDTFGRNQPVSQQLRRDFNLNREGRSATPPSATVNRYLPRTPVPERAVELQNIVARSASPEAGRQAVRDYLMADLAATGVIQDGFLRPDALRKWYDRWRPAFDATPDLTARTRDEVRGWIDQADAGQTVRANAAEDLSLASSLLSDVRRDKGAFAFVIGNDPANAMNRIFSGGDPERAVKQILDQIGTNNSALNGFRASVREYLQERGTTSALQTTASRRNPISFPNLDNLFKRHEDTLGLIFTPEQMSTLRAGHTLLRQLNNTGTQALPGSQTAQRLVDNIMKTAELGVRSVYGALEGGAIMKKLRLWADQLPSNREAVAEIQREAWFNPDLMIALLGRPIREAGEGFNRTLNRLLALAEGSREDQERRQNLAPSVEN